MLTLLLLLSGLFSIGTFLFDECPPEVPADYYLQIFGDFCYQFVFYQRRDYAGALDHCSGLGGTLALVKDNLTSYFLENQISHRYFRHADVWIGLSNLLDRVSFRWEDGTPLVYANWAAGQDPGSGIADDRCASLSPSNGGRWLLNPCTASSPELQMDFGKSFVCQYNKVVITDSPRPTTVPTYPTSALTTTLPMEVDKTTELTDILPESPSTSVTLTQACPALSCDLDCGVDGFKKNTTSGCTICQCDM